MVIRGAQELRAKVANTFKSSRIPQCNISREERLALTELKNDDSILILPADKGRSTVLLDRDTYKEKVNALLNDGKIYSRLDKDPTQQYKTELKGILKDLKGESAIDQSLYYKLSPTACDKPKLYGLPKIHKKDAPLRPIVSSIGSVTNDIARFVADIISPLVGKSEHHVQNTQDSVDLVKDLHVDEDESLVSYDVSALFTSILIDSAIVAIKRALEEDDTWKNRTYLNIDQVLKLLEFCLSITYFVFDDQFYKQYHGAAMGSAYSPLVANLFMERFEKEALNSAPCPPKIWLRYVDDTFVVLKTDKIQEFTDHINNVDTDIKFTIEPENNKQLPFLDILITRKEDGNLKVQVYRKPTHTDQYLHFESHHPLQHKFGVVKTLFHRADNIVTEKEDHDQELSHIMGALSRCGYKNWTFSNATQKKKPKTNSTAVTSDSGFKRKTLLPYVKRVSAKLKRIFGTYSVQTALNRSVLSVNCLLLRRTSPRL
ncbi:uncharacterized protein [Amphiura filiformis]|uniref:uncharacterized protein n=1 Tax=Amphiura filiformis TaxID=82378 RepID=UPI003B2109B9